jgi:hypothetical protein
MEQVEGFRREQTYNTRGVFPVPPMLKFPMPMVGRVDV